jgi:hypothetical protein
VNRVCRRLHFLHAAIATSGSTNGTEIGHYVIHLESGETFRLPLLIGQEIADWRERPGETNTTFTVAWRGSNEKSRRSGQQVRLFKSTWDNSIPGRRVRSVDLQASHAKSAPFLIAITAE